MISINNLDFYFGGRPIYENANLHIRPKDRVGLLGPNGAGKSTLLRLISGEYTPDGGSIAKSNECTIGFLNQDLLSYQSQESILEVAKQAFAEAIALQNEIDQLLLALESAYSDELVEKLTDKQARFETLGGYTMESQAEEILEGLGFSTEDLQKPLKQFSGGWRMRVMLAKLLLQKPDLLMLDEPTNHLDLPSIQWVENYIQSYEGAVLVVSHDRQFIENVAQIIVEVSNRQLVYYGGNYEFYQKEKVLRREIQQSAYENQQQKIKQTERFIERFRAKATKARQVQSRVKELERLDRIEEIIDENIAVNFRFNFGQPSGKEVIKVEVARKAYGPLTILKNTQATIMRGDKIALIGANGKGKSTLLRVLAGTEPMEGQTQLGYNVRHSFFAQHQLESLKVENDILLELQQAGSGKNDTELRGVLGCFLFKDEEVFKKIKVLSGGEKSRVALAKVLISEANFLLLDEPTNHLDIQSVNILVQALQQYAGTYVIVSHDRHFLSQVANKIWYIENQEIKEYPGTYDEYAYWQKQHAERQKTLVVAKSADIPKKEKPLPPPTLDPAQEKERKKYQKLIEELEKRIATLEQEQKRQEATLADPILYENPDALTQAQDTYVKLNQALETANTEWESLIMALDALEAAQK
ncbi:MAG: ABC-F family ATP-binding cassette domain-containing protein [Microscillaceae bacterium]|nr:ABC-F family ATP-binding cassette domain-containing protein [Microscillaceae bacterium]